MESEAISRLEENVSARSDGSKKGIEVAGKMEWKETPFVVCIVIFVAVAVAVVFSSDAQ